MAAAPPGRVRIREVGPRDGFQNEPELVPTEDKVRLIELLAGAGLRRIEVTSSVRAAAVPQLADAEEVLAAVTLPEARGVRARAERARARAGAGPLSVGAFFPAAREALGPGPELTAHFHNTRGQGLANVLAALEAGVDSFESSFGEIGGCPVPRGATGNIATEDLVSMLHEMGIETGVDLERLLEAGRALAATLRRPLGSHTLLAGPVSWDAGGAPAERRPR
jgi:isopropylmalate/homocitrate/citramalate synthase